MGAALSACRVYSGGHVQCIVVLYILRDWTRARPRRAARRRSAIYRIGCRERKEKVNLITALRIFCDRVTGEKKL